MKPRLLVISTVHPLPLRAAQNHRVRNKLLALRELFHITFLTLASADVLSDTQTRIETIVDKAIVLPYLSKQNRVATQWHRGVGTIKSLQTGLRYSNYLFGEVELSAERVASNVDPASFSAVLFEYWNTHALTHLFRKAGVKTVLDMHNVAWRVIQNHPNPWPVTQMMRPRRERLFREQEEAAWHHYDTLIAINAKEAEYVQELLPEKQVILAPMGTDMAKWPYRWSPARPPRIAFYGSMKVEGNYLMAQWCYENVMPLIWAEHPEVEFWIVGGHPPDMLKQLAAADERVVVTGFVDDIQETLAELTGVLCPWQGTFGIRSRLIEVMALGTPVVANQDAIFGLTLQDGEGVLLGESPAELAAQCLTLTQQADFALDQSKRARQHVEAQYSFEQTYGRLAQVLAEDL